MVQELTQSSSGGRVSNDTLPMIDGQFVHKMNKRVIVHLKYGALQQNH